MAIQKQCSM